MPNKISKLRNRLAQAISHKEFIPPLSMFDMASGVPLVTYDTKPEQLRTNIGWVRAANRAIVTPTASVPLKLRRLKANGDYEEIPQHEILDLLGDPHVALNGKKLRELNHTYLNLTGETFMLMRKGGEPFEMKDGVKALPDALELLPSHVVQFKLGRDRFSDSVVKYGQKDYKISQVIRGFNPDPENLYQGQSIISAAAAAIDSDQQVQSWNRRTFSNNARPGLVFNLQGENIDPAVYDRLKQQMDELYTADGAFKSLVVENGDVKPYMLTHQDLDFLASREFTRDEILAIFTVPASMLGMSQDYNRANIDGSRYIHVLLNVIPRLDDEMAMWNTQLVKKYDPTLELYYESPIPEDVEAKLKEAQAGTNLWRTIDETREQCGLEPLPDDLGAQLVVPINTTTLDRVINSKAAAAGTTDDKNDVTSEGKKSVPKPRQ